MTESGKPSGLSRDASALLRAARGGADATPEELARVLSRFRAKQPPDARGLLTGPFGGVTGRLCALDRSRGRRRGVRVAVAAAALVLTGSLAAVANWSGVLEQLGTWLPSAVTTERGGAGEPIAPAPHVSEPARASSDGPARRAAEPAETPRLSVEPAPASAPPAPPTPSARGAAATPTASPTHRAASGSELELDLIVAARNALRERRYADVRRESARHAAAFPRGELCEEREAIRALADCREGHDAERAVAFLRRWPSSLFVERVTRDCSLPPNSVPPARGRATH